MTSLFPKVVCVIWGAVVLISAVGFATADTALPASLSRAVPSDANWVLRLPKDEKVIYKGVVSFDGAGAGQAQILYPAPSALGFLAAVFTHGAIVESQKKAQKDKLQEEADRVLTPYQTILSNYSYKELFQSGLEKMSAQGGKKLITASDAQGNDWVIQAVPIFSMTQDQSAVILENAVMIYKPGGTEPIYQNAVRIVSDTKDAPDLTKFWAAQDGKNLREESATMFANSLDIVIREAAKVDDAANNTQKTVRYSEGHAEKMERAELISERCGRVVIKTLRGWLMSVPASASRGAGQCEGSLSGGVK